MEVKSWTKALSEMAVAGESKDLRGVRRLAGAVLTQAIEDMRSGAGKRRMDAIGWILGSGDGKFSFIFCCRILNRNPEGMRRFLATAEPSTLALHCVLACLALKPLLG